MGISGYSCEKGIRDYISSTLIQVSELKFPSPRDIFQYTYEA